ncbi:MAG TPA: hypothetical protein GX699_03445 [Firmicutes bacterium]|nr:hypothetical protein [Bacillota bacterium]
MGKGNAKWASFAARWQGKINDSALIITKKTVDRKKRYDYINIASYCVYAVLGLWFLLTAKTNLTHMSGGFSMEIVIPFVLLLTTAAILQLVVNAYKAPYQKIKDLLRERIDAQFCNCYYDFWGAACSHKEDFIKDVKETFDLNLYY